MASAQELEHVELVVVDNEAIIKRVLGQLIDLLAFDEAAYERIGSSNKGIHARIRELRNYLVSLSRCSTVEIKLRLWHNNVH